MSDKPSAPARVQAAYRKLSASAINLNAASDELRKTISFLEDALKQLNLGVSAWVVITTSQDDQGTFCSRSLGYAKVGNEWGIALRDVTGNDAWDEDETEIWRFNDAPRWMRIESVGKIPELLEHLTKQADNATEQIKKKTAEAKELAAAIKAATAEPNTVVTIGSAMGEAMASLADMAIKARK
jgi:prefoldin subunit 5